MKCQDIMSSPVYCVNRGETVTAAARKMRDNDIGFLAIIADDGHVVGVVTDRDIVTRLCADNLSSWWTRIDAIMSDTLITCSPEDDLKIAEQRMSDNQKSRILIIDENAVPRGVISLSDLAWQSDSQAARTLRQVARRPRA